MKTPDADSKRGGTQSIERAVTILRTLATRDRFGWGLTELAAVCGLTKATTHRILGRLERERLVHKRVEAERYFIGALVGELALSIPGFSSFAQETQAFTADVAARFGLVCVLSLRSGDHFVVAARATTGHLKAELNEVGSRRPLASTSGGVAMLVALPAAEQRRIFHSYVAQMALRGHAHTADVRAMWDRSRALGYGLNRGDTTPSLQALAVPALNRRDEPFASVTLAGPQAHLTDQRCHELVPKLRLEAARYAELAARVHPDLYDCAAALEGTQSAS